MKLLSELLSILAKPFIKKNRKIISTISLVFLLVIAAIQLFDSNFLQDSRILGESDTKNYELAFVERIVDGDTIELSDGRKVRYIGADTPETKNPRVGVQCFGKEASKFNASLVSGRWVRLEKDVNDTDKYGRLLRYVWIDDVLVNKKLIAEGFAFARSFPPDIKRQDELKKAEKAAREANLGLWAECDLNDASKINNDIEQWDEKMSTNSFEFLINGLELFNE